MDGIQLYRLGDVRSSVTHRKRSGFTLFSPILIGVQALFSKNASGQLMYNTSDGQTLQVTSQPRTTEFVVDTAHSDPTRAGRRKQRFRETGESKEKRSSSRVSASIFANWICQPKSVFGSGAPCANLTATIMAGSMRGRSYVGLRDLLLMLIPKAHVHMRAVVVPV